MNTPLPPSSPPLPPDSQQIPPRRAADKAVPALVLGILGVVLCPICAPIAWSMGGKVEREIDDCAGALGGRGMATAARVLGIVGTVLLVVYVVAFLVWFVLMGLLFGADRAIFDEIVTQP